MDILDFISQDNYIVYNKKLAKEIGINETILFMYFVSQYKWFSMNNQLTDDGYFYKTADDIYENTGLSRYQQKQATETLRNLGFIDFKVKGVPATLHFKIFKDQLQTLFFPSFQETGKLDLKKLENKSSRNLKSIYNNNIIINNNNKLFNDKSLNTKSDDFEKKNNPSDFLILEKEDVYKQKKRDDIDFLISKIKEFCNENKISYDKTKERQFGKHIMDSKDYGEFCVNIGQDRITFALNVLKASIKINYWKGICAGPMKIYQNYAEVYNKTLLEKKKQEKSKVSFIPGIYEDDKN